MTDLISSDGAIVRPGDLIELVHFPTLDTITPIILHHGIYIKHHIGSFKALSPITNELITYSFTIVTMVEKKGISDCTWIHTSNTDKLRKIC